NSKRHAINGLVQQTVQIVVRSSHNLTLFVMLFILLYLCLPASTTTNAFCKSFSLVQVATQAAC
ncbi:MAG: hypothetical protein PF495_14550, partial [Spirochaetales bacterium]|nr:hypothetical protein [Spirochaetales bacterium]